MAPLQREVSTATLVLDGAAVQTGEVADVVVNHHIEFRVGEYALPFWVVWGGVGASAPQEVTALPQPIQGRGSTVRLTSTNPNTVQRDMTSTWDVGSASLTYGIATRPQNLPSLPLNGVDFNTGYTAYAGPVAGDPGVGNRDIAFTNADAWTAMKAALDDMHADTGSNWSAGDATILGDPGSTYQSDLQNGMYLGPTGTWDKPGTGVLTLGTTHGTLSTVSRRVAPSDKPNMPLLKVLAFVSSKGIYITPGCTWALRIVGWAFENDPLQTRSSLVEHVTIFTQDSDIQSGFMSLGCLYQPMQTSWTPEFRRPLYLRCNDFVIWRNYTDVAMSNNTDSQAILFAQGGRGLIVDNLCGGGSENIIFGGAQPEFDAALPHDILIERNHFYNPLSFQAINPNYFKNGGEVKNLRRGEFRGNVFENGWAGAQIGNAYLIKATNQNGIPAQNFIESVDIAIHHNIFTNFPQGLTVLNVNGAPVQAVRRVVIDHNLFTKIGAKADFPSVTARMMRVVPDTVGLAPGGPHPAPVQITNNTVDGGGSLWNFEIETDGLNWGGDSIFRGNIFGSKQSWGPYAVNGGDGALVSSRLNASIDNGDNVWAACLASQNTQSPFATDHYPVDDADIGWVNAAAGNYRIQAGKAWALTSGIDQDALEALTGPVSAPTVRSTELTP